MAIFVDTNVIVYGLLGEDPSRQPVAQQLIEDLWGRGEAVISSQVLVEFANTALRLGGDPPVVQQQVRLLAAAELVVIEDSLVCEAIALRDRYQISFWDACILAAASRAGCETIYSEDLNAGQRYGSVQVVNPFDALPGS